MSRPLSLVKADDDCFGNLFSFKAPECTKCLQQWACQEVCMKFEPTENKGLLGANRDYDFDPFIKSLSKGSISYEEVFKKIKQESKIPDNRTIEIVIENFIFENQLNLTKDGKTITRL
jgi:hypothetical protein